MARVVARRQRRLRMLAALAAGLVFFSSFCTVLFWEVKLNASEGVIPRRSIRSGLSSSRRYFKELLQTKFQQPNLPGNKEEDLHGMETEGRAVLHHPRAEKVTFWGSGGAEMRNGQLDLSAHTDRLDLGLARADERAEENDGKLAGDNSGGASWQLGEKSGQREEGKVNPDLTNAEQKRVQEALLKTNDHVNKTTQETDKIPFRVRNLTLDPARRRTGLPLLLSDWSAESVFVISTGEDGRVLQSLKHVADLFSSAGLQFTRAVWPLDMSPEVLKSYSNLLSPLPLPFGLPQPLPASALLQYGLAHAEIWARVVQQRLPFAMVFENDVQNTQEDGSRWRARLQQLLRQLNFLIIQRNNRFFFDLLLLARKTFTEDAEVHLSANIVQSQTCLGMHAYIVTFEGAKKLLRQIRFDRTLNEAVWTMLDVNILAATAPFFASHMHLCQTQPCRFPAPSAVLSTDLSGTCQSTIFLGTPGHLRLPGCSGSIRQLEDAKPSLEDGAFAACGTPAACLVRVARKRLQKASLEATQREPNGFLPRKLDEWPVFVVSLFSDGSRFEELEEKMSREGFGEVTRAFAVEPDRTDMLIFRSLVEPNHRSVTRSNLLWHDQKHGLVSKGEVGCALSHYLVWTEIVAKKLSYVIVFEDDVNFTTGSFKRDFEESMQEVHEIMRTSNGSQNFDVLFIGSLGAIPMHLHPRLSLHVFISPLAWCTYAYIVTSEGARKLVNGFYVDDPLDSIWWRIPEVKFWSFEPALATHLSSKAGQGEGKLQSRVQDYDAKW